MPDVSSVTQVVQLGVETTPGTAVAATKRLSSISIEPKRETDIKTFRPAGNKFNTLAVQNKEWTSASISGIPTFHEIVYLLSSLLTTATITTPGGGTNSRLWTFAPSSTAADTTKTFTIERGNSTSGVKFPYGLVTGLTFDISRDDIGISGEMIGQLMSSAAITGGASALAQVPISPNYVSVYMDDTAAGIGTTKLTRAFKASPSISNRFAPVWPLDASKTSFAGHVETAPEAKSSMLIEADSVADGIVANMRAGTKKFMRIEAVGPVIEAAIPYRLTLDFPILVSAVNNYEDVDGVYAIGFDFTMTDDTTFGGALKAEVVTDLTAL